MPTLPAYAMEHRNQMPVASAFRAAVEHALQLAGAAAVLAGALLVTWHKRVPAPQV